MQNRGSTFWIAADERFKVGAYMMAEKGGFVEIPNATPVIPYNRDWHDIPYYLRVQVKSIGDQMAVHVNCGNIGSDCRLDVFALSSFESTATLMIMELLKLELRK